MRMSGSCRRADAARGFTLLELLIVLAILAGASAIVAPRLQATYDAIVSSSERAEVRRSLERLPLVAREGGRDLRLAPTSGGAAALQALVPVPDGWQVRPLDPVVVHRSGVCEPARLAVARGAATETWQLTAPLCTVEAGVAE